MMPLKILRHNTRLVSKLPRFAQLQDAKQFKLLDAQARHWNELNVMLRTARGDARTPILDLMEEIMDAVNAGIERRNTQFKDACVAAGIWDAAPTRRPAKAKRQARKSRPNAAVVALRKSFRALGKAA